MYPSNKKEVEAQKVIAEKLNGRLAMLGLVIGTVNYVLFGEIAPGFF